jgi:muramoyltetrapeptide carboxypeptidase
VGALERMGFRVRYTDRIFESSGYLAGSDEDRANELMRCFADPEVRAVLPLRGGYGCARLIPLLDEHRLRHFPKFFMGFSDNTTLHLYFRRRLGWVTLHGPMMVSTALADPPADGERHLVSLLTDPHYRPQYAFPQLQSWVPGIAEGVLAGGCLSLITASIGTSYEIKTEGKILFLEDSGEAAYRLDRMLTHLELAGKLDGVAGIVLGTFQDCDPPEASTRAQDTLRERLVRLGVPILAGLPAGHGPENWALPLGVRVRLDCNRGVLRCLEPAARDRA